MSESMSTSSKSLDSTVLAPTVKVDQVTKVFGRVAAVRETSFLFQSHKLYVLLGDNGAGKSTLLRIIAGLIQPTGGRLEVQGASRDSFGYMAHASLLYDELSGLENLLYFASLYGLADSKQHCAQAMSNVGLEAANPKPVRDYSQGMRQRLSLARAVVHSPRIILLDEPFSNVDAASANQMTKHLARLRDSGCTILLVTHQMSVIKEIGDEFLTMRAGQIVEVRRRAQLRPTETSL